MGKLLKVRLFFSPRSLVVQVPIAGERLMATNSSWQLPTSSWLPYAPRAYEV